MVTPYINEETASDKDQNTALTDFYKVLLYLDNSELKKLFGEIEITASKNAYLPILAGCVLGSEKIILKDYPNYLDTENMCKILRNLGAKVEKNTLGYLLCDVY